MPIFLATTANLRVRLSLHLALLPLTPALTLNIMVLSILQVIACGGVCNEVLIFVILLGSVCSSSTSPLLLLFWFPRLLWCRRWGNRRELRGVRPWWLVTVPATRLDRVINDIHLIQLLLLGIGLWLPRSGMVVEHTRFVMEALGLLGKRSVLGTVHLWVPRNSWEGQCPWRTSLETWLLWI